jgi:hypothetical protein
MGVSITASSVPASTMFSERPSFPRMRYVRRNYIQFNLLEM